jgi:hypothetical protein
MYPGAQPMFSAPKEHEKTAGYKLPENPKHWQSEIIRYLKSMHPYLPLEDSEIDLRRLDAAKGSAVGSVILSKEIAIPIIIGRPRPGADPELSPMDVFFHKGNYRFLDPEAIKQLSHKPQIGTPEKGPMSRAVGGNPYVGDMTGDATPLEYSGQASPFAGPYDGAKTGADISRELLPEWMLKEALSEEAKDQAAKGGVIFGLTGGISGAASGASAGLKKGKNLKERVLNATLGAAKGGVKGTAKGVALGATAGAATPAVKRALGIEKKQKKKDTQHIKQVMKKELEKEAFTAGLKPILENGHVAWLIKNAYLDPNDLSNFRNMLATNPHILQGSGHNFELVEIVARRGPTTPGTRMNTVKNPNIMQVYKKPDGSMCIKFSGGPETKTTPAELKTILGDRFQEVMSKLRSGQVFMEHDGVNQASWDTTRPMSEAKHVTRDGLYSIRTYDGETIVGMVVKSMMDFDGKTLPMKLFVTPEGKYAIAGEMFGVRLNDKHRLPSQPPTAGQSGVFVNYVHGTPISTLPLRLISVKRLKPANDGDARMIYMVSNPMTGEKFALSPVQRVQGFERMHVVDNGVKTLAEGNPVYYMPGDSEWVALRNPVRVAESEEELKKISSFDGTHLTFSSGMWHVDAQLEMHSFTKNETITKEAAFHDLDGPNARELLVGMGVSTDDVEALLYAARERDGVDRGVKISGLHAPHVQAHEVAPAPQAIYSEDTVLFAESCRLGPEIVKAAAESGHPETLDSILSLEFITPQNLRYFVDNIPDFEEAATRLAALLIAVRLGMPHVPEQPVKDALEGLSHTINKLNILKSATDHKNERAASATK